MFKPFLTGTYMVEAIILDSSGQSVACVWARISLDFTYTPATTTTVPTPTTTVPRPTTTPTLRDGVKKSKWKFKMAFAMKGGGLEGSRVPFTYFEK